MTDESPAKRGEAAWNEQRADISRRNAEAHKRAQVGKRSRASVAARAARDELDREAEQLRELNARISKRQNARAG
jgi:hypothetical protein